MADRLWTSNDAEDLADWRPERPEPPRQRAARKPLPERAPVPALRGADRGGRRRRRRRARARRAPGGADQGPSRPGQGVGQRHPRPPAPAPTSAPSGPADVGLRRAAHPPPPGGRRDGHRRTAARRSPPAAARPPPSPPAHRRGWVAPFLSAVVGALVVVIVFLLFFRDDVTHNTTAAAPLPASTGGGGAAINARTVYAHAAKSVVSIRARMSTGMATGTGFMIDGRDTIVTNAHVVGTAESVQVQFGDQGQVIPGTVIGKDVSSDLAVVHVDPAEHTANPLPLADSSDVRVGDAVVAIGNPFGLNRTATAGIVSATDRHISRPTASTSTTSSRPTRRSTPATPAARCSTRAAG